MYLEKVYHTGLGNLDIEMIDVKLLPDVYKIRIRVNYDGLNFLAINFNNIGLSSPTGKCYNLKKTLGKFHFNPNRRTEVINLAFSRDCAALGSRDKKLTFRDIFTAYSTDVTTGFKISQRLVKVGPNEGGKRSKPDIELIG